jgi:hypothetical protein
MLDTQEQGSERLTDCQDMKGHVKLFICLEPMPSASGKVEVQYVMVTSRLRYSVV